MAARCMCPPRRRRVPTRSRRSWNFARGTDVMDDDVFTIHPKSQQFVKMDPEMFLYLTLPPDTNYEAYFNNSDVDYRRYERRLEADLPLDAAHLWVDISKGNRVFGHEGRHRAWAAIRVGLGHIPVMLFICDSRGVVDLTQHPEARVNPSRLKRQYDYDNMSEWPDAGSSS